MHDTKDESPNITYGRLKESVNISGYSLERAMQEFDWLLDNDRWKKVGDGFDDINNFLDTINLSEFKIAIDQRKKISLKLASLQASQRITAKALGVGQGTILRDINGSESYDSPGKKSTTDNECVTNYSESYDSPEDVEPEWMDNSPRKFVNKQINEEKRKKGIEKKREEIKSGIIDMPEDTYRVIYADPPWSYNDKQDTSMLGGAEKHYTSMSIQELCDMELPKIKDDAVLFLWTTSPLLEDTFKVINAWGFKYKTSFVWDKVKHNMGHYNSVRHEFLLVCTKGSCTPDNVKLFDSVQIIERSEKHSEKPHEFYDIIETLYEGNKIELFARNEREGWSSFGNEFN